MSLKGKYHINPETGNANKCAAEYSCRFKVSENAHYETKVDAQKGAEENLAAEIMDTNKTLSIINKLTSKIDNDNKDFNAIEMHSKNIKEWKATPWTKHERENLYRTEQLAELLRKTKLTEEDWEKADQIKYRLHTKDYSKTYQSNTFGKNILNEFNRRDQNIIDLAENLYLKRKSDEILEPKSVSPRETNDRIIGLRDSQLANFRKYNDPGYDFMHGAKIMGDSAEDYFDKTLDRVAAGQEYEPFDYRAENNSFVTPKHDVFMREISNSNQLYMATAFPDNELKKAMELADVSNVTATSFYNSREWGNAYTVMTPDGGTRTFSVYEHRNSDSIIINGKNNWKGVDEELPYAGDSKQAFFAEFGPDERQRAASTLTFFMKGAQDGSLNSDNHLVKNAPRIDWISKLSAAMPAFKEWHETNYPADAAANGLKSDDDILSRLDFETE